MKREDAHNNVKEWIDDIEYDKNTWHYGKIELHRDINKIYDDFENRSCENCKHQNEGSIRFFCSKTNISFDIGGCGDYWESK